MTCMGAVYSLGIGRFEVRSLAGSAHHTPRTPNVRGLDTRERRPTNPMVLVGRQRLLEARELMSELLRAERGYLDSAAGDTRDAALLRKTIDFSPSATGSFQRTIA